MSEERKKFEKDMTNEALKEKFTQELGQKVRVDRTTFENDDHMAQLREVLADVARDLQKVGKVPAALEYMGSLSVHVYKSEVLKTMIFATLSNSGRLTFDVADGALRELTGATREDFGKSRQKLRSGF